MSVINTKDDILKEMSEVEQCPDIITKLRFLIQRRNTLSQRLGISGDLFTIRILEEAISALEAQEPRVMTWQEVIRAALECKPVYIEVLDSEDKEPGDDRWAMVTQYKDSITNGMIRAMSSYITSEILFAEGYNKSWRCWTSHPTDAQREATPWMKS